MKTIQDELRDVGLTWFLIREIYDLLMDVRKNNPNDKMLFISAWRCDYAKNIFLKIHGPGWIGKTVFLNCHHVSDGIKDRAFLATFIDDYEHCENVWKALPEPFDFAAHALQFGTIIKGDVELRKKLSIYRETLRTR